MKITLITVGKTAFPFIEEGIMVYQKRLAHYCAFARNEIPELKGVSALTKEQIKEKEYYTDLSDRGCKNIISYGIAFCGKDIDVSSK